MKIYLRILAILYACGAILHLLDIFSLRLNFSEMSAGWKAWIIFLLIFDSITALGTWRLKNWGTKSFLLVASSQLIAYVLFKDFFGEQITLVIFHLVTIAIFFILKLTALQKAS